MAQSPSESKFPANQNEINSEHIEEGTASGDKMNMKTNICINSETDTNHITCKKYTEGRVYYPSFSTAEESKLMRLSAEYEDIICSSPIVGKVNFIIEAYNSLLKHNESNTGENKSTRQSIEDLTKHRETHPDFSVQKLRKLFETERPPQMMIASSSRTSRVDYSKTVRKAEKSYASFETEDVISHGKVIKYSLEINKYESTNIETQYHKTMEKFAKTCKCNVQIFADKSGIETKMSHDKSSVKTLDEHSEYTSILINETAHESNDNICRTEELSLHSPSNSKQLDDSTATRESCPPREECIINMLEHQDHEGTTREIKLEVKIECPKDMESSLREVLNRLSLFSALNPYNYFLLAYITTKVLRSQTENLRLLKKSILEECWNLTLAILDKIRRYLVDTLNICQEHLLAYFEGLLLSMFITSSAVMNRITFRK